MKPLVGLKKSFCFSFEKPPESVLESLSTFLILDVICKAKIFVEEPILTLAMQDHYPNKRLRTWVTLALDIPRYLAKSALDLMPLVPIRAFHCLARSIASSPSCDRGFR